MGSQFHGGGFVLELGLFVEELVDPNGQRESRAIEDVIFKAVATLGVVLRTGDFLLVGGKAVAAGAPERIDSSMREGAVERFNFLNRRLDELFGAIDAIRSKLDDTAPAERWNNINRRNERPKPIIFIAR